jgi:hypothetical protein
MATFQSMQDLGDSVYSSNLLQKPLAPSRIDHGTKGQFVVPKEEAGVASI